MSDIYREIILDYYRHPRNYGTIEGPSIRVKDANPLCGDEVEIQVKLNGEGKIVDVKFNGKGCAISQASASMLTEMVKGISIYEAKQIEKNDIFDALGNPELGPTRVKCALLSLKVLKTGIYSYLGGLLEFKEE